jgi:antitoxin (DNA-binding transcriptional repressor) of toxin-antitoxin stability system
MTKDVGMEQVKIAEARERLEELVDRAAAGETILIERDGGAGVRLVRDKEIEPPAPKFDAEEHLRWLQTQPMDPRSPEEIDAELRSLDRYQCFIEAQ